MAADLAVDWRIVASVDHPRPCPSRNSGFFQIPFRAPQRFLRLSGFRGRSASIRRRSSLSDAACDVPQASDAASLDRRPCPMARSARCRAALLCAAMRCAKRLRVILSESLHPADSAPSRRRDLRTLLQGRIFHSLPADEFADQDREFRARARARERMRVCVRVV